MKEISAPTFPDDVFPGLHGICDNCGRTFETEAGDKGMIVSIPHPSPEKALIGQRIEHTYGYNVLCPNCGSIFCILDPDMKKRKLHETLKIISRDYGLHN